MLCDPENDSSEASHNLRIVVLRSPNPKNIYSEVVRL